MAQLAISERSSNQLSELSKKRKAEDALISSKKKVIEDLIDQAHKKECK